jgi:hypothetical protein
VDWLSALMKDMRDAQDIRHDDRINHDLLDECNLLKKISPTPIPFILLHPEILSSILYIPSCIFTKTRTINVIESHKTRLTFVQLNAILMHHGTKKHPRSSNMAKKVR